MTAVVLRGDARALPLPDGCVDLIVTSPPYFGLRSYTDDGAHYDGQIGSEATPAEWLAALVECTAEWVRVLKPSGSLFVNLGDKYANDAKWGGRSNGKQADSDQGTPGYRRRLETGYAPKSLMGLPWRYALACTDELGLILRRDIIWSKPNGLPESVTDRCRSSHEYVFHLVRQPRYYAAVDEIRELHVRTWAAPGGSGNPGTSAVEGRLKNGTLATCDPNPLGKLPGSVWEIPSQPLAVPPGLGVDHFAAFPMELPRRCILGWSPPGVCTECGEGRRPVVDKHKVANRPTHLGVAWHEYIGRSSATDYMRGNHSAAPIRTEATITGYACACPQPDAPVRPAVVLDPFGGTGTTALVASMLGRVGISVDRSADYCRLARWRTTDPAERARALEVPKPPPVPDGQGSLFDGEAV